MKSIVVVIALLVSMAVGLQAQGCPSGYTAVTRTFSVPNPAGGCCSVTVSFCYKIDVPNNKFLLEYRNVTFSDQACAVLFGPGLFNWVSKKIYYYYAGGAIPNCPSTATLVLDESKYSCYSFPDPPANINDPVTYIPCGSTVCRRVCAVCLSTSETDPCTSPAEPMLVYAGCQNTTVVCEGAGTGAKCGANTCSSTN